jgi:hypothetical protein
MKGFAFTNNGFCEAPNETLPGDRPRSFIAAGFFGNKAEFATQIKQDCARQSDTTSAILRRFLGAKEGERRELMILADEVGLGKTYVALAVAVSILDAIRRGEAPDALPSNKPVILVLIPTNDALFNARPKHSRRIAPEMTADWSGFRSAAR